MRTDLSITRIGMAEHAYPTPTRNILSEQQRARKRPTPDNGDVRIGRRLPDGTTVWAHNPNGQRNLDAIHQEADRANVAMDKRLHQERMTAILNGHMVESDHWAHKS